MHKMKKSTFKLHKVEKELHIMHKRCIIMQKMTGDGKNYTFY